MATPPEQIYLTFRMNGASGADILNAQAATVLPGEINSSFNGLIVDAKDGDDWILRDRVGAYLSNSDGETANAALNGGGGFDTLSYVTADAGIVARLDVSTSLTGIDLQGHGDLPTTGYGFVSTRLTDASPTSHTLRGIDYVRSIEKLVGSTHDDFIVGGDGAEVLMGHDGNDEIHGGGGHDKLYGGNGDDEVHGGNGNDYVEGNDGDDVLTGGFGMDTIRGGDGDDTIDGGHHNDVLYGDAGNDVISGGHGSDVIHVGEGTDTVSGGSGNDTVHLNGFGNNTVDGGTGSDTVVFSTTAIVNLAAGIAIRGTEGTDSLNGIENVTGSAYADSILGSDVANVIKAGGGADWIMALDGNDKIWAGSGKDHAYGGDGDDTIYGESGDDYLDGGNGDDVLFGGSGNDTIRGGAGNDEFWGGAHADTFLWNVGDDGLDRIRDFNVTQDKLAFGDGVLAAGAPKDNLFATNIFGLGTTLVANTADDGWELLAVVDNVSASALNQRIDNGTIFNVQVNEDLGEIPGDLEFAGLDDPGVIQLGYWL